MKRTLIFLFLTLCSLSFTEQVVLLDEVLTSTKWIGAWNNCFFKSNRTVKIQDHYDDAYFEYTGTFSIKNNRLILTYKLNKDKSVSYNSELYDEEYTVEYKLLAGSYNNGRLEVRDILEMVHFESEAPSNRASTHKNRMSYLIAENHFLNSSTIKTINGINIKLLKRAKAVTTANLRMRAAPDVNSKKYIYIGMDYEEFPYLPEGETITILAKTQLKYKVSDWENYWYYVDIPASKRLEGSPFFEGSGVWVYGEFIDIKE